MDVSLTGWRQDGLIRAAGGPPVAPRPVSGAPDLGARLALTRLVSLLETARRTRCLTFLPK
eukprot:10750417-Alexandrium_andersonii.AAC.1